MSRNRAMKERGLDILLVEDNEGDVELIRIAFKRSGAAGRLAVAHDGAEAVEYLYRRGPFRDAVAPDIIMADLNMPRMGGKEFLDVVKGDPALKAIPVIMLTSSRNPAEILECYRRHANCYILKPSGLDELAGMMRQMEVFWTQTAKLPREGR